MAEADLVLAFGANLTRWTTRDGELIARGAKVVQVDLDEESLGAHRPVHVARRRRRRRDGRGAARRRRLQRGLPRHARARARDRRGLVARRAVRGRRRRDPPRPARALDRARRAAAQPSARWPSTPGTSWASRRCTCACRTRRGSSSRRRFQSIGLGLASGIGAAIARPDRLTVACVGDGGALMALRRARDARPPAAADARRGLQRRRLRRRGPPLRAAGAPARARALPRHRLRRARARRRRAGRHGTRRSTTSTPVARWLERRDGPLVLDAKITPDFCAEWLEEAFK